MTRPARLARAHADLQRKAARAAAQPRGHEQRAMARRMLVGTSGPDSVDTAHKRNASQHEQACSNQRANARAWEPARGGALGAKWRSVRRASAFQAIATLSGIDGALGCNCLAGAATTSDVGPFKLCIAYRGRTAKGTWCSGITSASHAEGPGFKSQCVHSCSLLRGLFALLSSSPFLSPCFLPVARAQERAMGTLQTQQAQAGSTCGNSCALGGAGAASVSTLHLGGRMV